MKVFFFGVGYCARRLIQREPWIEASGTAAFTEGEWTGHAGVIEFVKNQMEVLDQMWVRGFIGEWGDCKEGLSAAQLRSRYPYKTAEEHYNALLAQTKANGAIMAPR